MIAWLGPEFSSGIGSTTYLWIGLTLGVLGIIFGRSRA
jgi:hypothetical protein